MRVLIRHPRGSIGVEVGSAELLKEATVLEGNRYVGHGIYLLGSVFRDHKVIWLTRLGTDAEVAGNIQKETHFWRWDSRWRGGPLQFFSEPKADQEPKAGCIPRALAGCRPRAKYLKLSLG